MSAESDRLLPRLPAGWITTPVRYATTCLDGKRVPLNVGERSSRQGDYPYWGANGIVDSVDEYLFDEPLVLLGEDGAPFFDKTKPVAFFVSERVWVNNHIHVLRVAPRFDARFVVHALNATDYGSWIEGSTRDKLTQDKMGSILLPTPPLPQQRAIADYLDRETARLDSLVAAKERVLGLLAEKRRALITRAVTRGLDPRAPLRDSGIPWLGEIPTHWRVIPLKHACSLIKDGTHLPPERTITGIPLLSVRNVVGETFRTLPDDSLIAEEDYELLCRAFRIERNDVLLAIVGATLGKVAVVGDMPRFHIQRSLAAFRANPKLLDFNYLASCLRSDWFQAILWESVSFSAQPGIYLGSLRDLVVTRPPLEEQRAIAARVSSEAYKLDAIQSATEHTITLLKERRAALIAAAVTGQIDVAAAA